MPKPSIASKRGLSFFAVLLAGFLALDGAAQEILSNAGGAPPPMQVLADTLSLAERVEIGKAPVSKLQKYHHIRVTDAAVHRLAPVNESELPKRRGKREQIGVERPLDRALDLAKAVLYPIDGGQVALVGVISEAAVMTRVHFDSFTLPEGARVFVYSMTDPDDVHGPYERRGPTGNGSFWSPPIEGEGVVIEYFAPGAAEINSGASPFRVSKVSHIYARPIEHSGEPRVGACHPNVPSTWASSARSVGRLQFTDGGEYVCTGTLLNSTTGQFEPYLLTAQHCIGSQAVAQTLRVWWNFDSASQTLASRPRTDGSNLLSTGTSTDFTFLRLTGTLPSGLWWSGWDANLPAAGLATYGIHHPGGTYKRYAAGSVRTPSCPSSVSSCTRQGWTSGVTEGGSSGSALFRGDPADPRVVGQLWGGSSSCTYPTADDYYGRLDVTISSIRQWLNPVTAQRITSPASGTALNSSPVTFNWTSGADQYWLYVGRTLGGAEITSVDRGTATSGSIAIPAGSYTLYVRFFYRVGSGWSNIDYTYPVSIALPPPTATTLVSPSGTIATSSPSFTWNKIAAATWYYLWVNVAGGANVTQTWYQSANVCGSTTCSVTLPVALASNTAYNWWVQTWSSSGYGPWSAQMSFTVELPVAPVGTTLTAPSGTITSATPTFTWNRVANATWYYLWVNSASGTAVIQSWHQSSVCNTTACSVIPSVPLLAGSYTWWIQTYNGYGYGPWSAGMSFTSASSPPASAPSVVAPLGSVSTLTPTFQWQAVANATAYYLWVSNPNGPVIQTVYQATAICSGGVCSNVSPLTLTNGVLHTWWVQASNAAGAGPWTGASTFTPTNAGPPPAATLISPSGATMTVAQFRWNAVAGATWYYLWVQPVNGIPVIQRWLRTEDACSSTTCQAALLINLPSNTTYTWWIQTYSVGGYGPWSSGMQFTIP